MKTRIKHYSRSAISVLLSLCMLVSCMTVGLIATDAAVASADEAVGDPSPSLYFHLWGTGLTVRDTTLAVKGTFYDVYETGSNEVTVGFSLIDGNKEYCNGEGFAEGESVGDGRTDKWMNNKNNTSYGFHNVKLDANSVYQVRWTQYDSGNDKIQIDIRKKPPTVTLSVGNAPTGNSGAVTSTACVTVDGAAYDAPTTSVTVNKGKTATVTVIPSDDTYKATTFTVNNGSGKDLTYDRMSGTYIGSFDLTENATVTFQGLQQKSSYKVNVVSADDTEGTVSAVVNGAPLDPEASYLEGTAIELTGVPNGDFVFSRWAFKKTADDESRKTTYYLDAKDVTSGTATITGYFSVDGYQISVDNGPWVDMKMLDDGRYISTSTIDKNKKFYLKRQKDGKLSYAGGASDYKFHSDWKTGKVPSWKTSSDMNQYRFYQIIEDHLYVVYDPKTDKISFNSDSEGHTGTKVYAKDGALFKDDHASSYSSDTSVKFGDTSITKVMSGSSDITSRVENGPNNYEGYVESIDLTGSEVAATTKITIKTKVKNSYRDNMKVSGFVVNGTSVTDLTVGGTNSDEYSFTYTVPEYPPEKIEITPVYSFKSGNIRFYVTGVDGDVRDEWGDTFYCYAYYGSKTSATYALGTWPGQPMLFENGRYYIDLPINASGKKINGISLSNGTWDTVHVKRLYGGDSDTIKNDNQHQTYDYDDFVRISNIITDESLDQDIIFEFKFKGTSDTQGNFGNTYSSDGSIYPSTITPAAFTNWEYLTDFYRERVDIFGNIIKPSDAHYNDTHPLRIVSQGYDENSVGFFATSWIIYEYNSTNGKYEKKKYVGTDSESYLLTTGLDEDTAWSAYKGIPALITYEYQINQGKSNDGHYDGTGSGQPAYRSDGRWYISKDREVKAHVLIEYGKNINSEFVRDYFQKNEDGTEYVDYTWGEPEYKPELNTGLSTKTKAYFSDDNKTESVKSTAKSEANKFNFVAEEDAAGNYTFIGWYKYNDKGEAELVSEKMNYSVDVKNDEVLIARFIETPAGVVTISHELLPSSAGMGKTYNTVTIVDSNGDDATDIVGYKVSENSQTVTKVNKKIITSENAGNGYQIKIDLKTERTGSATFNKFQYKYLLEQDLADLVKGTGDITVDDIQVNSTTGEATATIHVPISYFFSSEGSFVSEKSTLNYYSGLSVPPSRTVYIQKNTDHDDTQTEFKIRIQTKSGDGDYEDYHSVIKYGPGASDKVNPVHDTANNLYYYNIKKGQKFEISGVLDGTTFKVTEIDHEESHYTFDNDGTTVTTEGTSARGNVEEGSDGRWFTVNGGNPTMTISNKVRKVSVKVVKETNFAYQDDSIFNITVECNPYKVLPDGYRTVNDGKYKELPTDSEYKKLSATDSGTYPVKKGGFIEFEVPLGSMVRVTETSIGVSGVTNRQRFTYDKSELSFSPAEGEATDNGRYFKATQNCTLTIHNKIFRENMTITKKLMEGDDILDGENHDDAHIITVTALDNGNKNTSKYTSNAITELTYTSSFIYKLDEEGHKVYTKQTVAAGGDISIHQGEVLTFNYPVGTVFTVKEKSPHADYSYRDIEVKNAATHTVGDDNAAFNNPDYSTAKQVTFQTQNNATAEVSVYNEKIPYKQLKITKQVENYSDSTESFKIQVKTGSSVADAVGSVLSFVSSDTGRTGDLTLDSSGITTIKAGETLTFDQIPYNKYVVVTELTDEMPTYYSYTTHVFDTSGVTEGASVTPTSEIAGGFSYKADKNVEATIKNKLSIPYRVDYTYPSRFDLLKKNSLYGDQTYSVTGVLDKESDFTGENVHYNFTAGKLTAALVNDVAPFEEDFMFHLQFTFDDDHITYSKAADGTLTAATSATAQENSSKRIIYLFPYSVTKEYGNKGGHYYVSASPKPEYIANPSQLDDGLISYQSVPHALTTKTYTDEDGKTNTVDEWIYSEAPEFVTRGGEDYAFLFWSIREQDLNVEGESYVEVARCYSRSYNYATFANYIVRPMYECDFEDGAVPDSPYASTKSATLSFLGYTRNQWNDSQGGAKTTVGEDAYLNGQKAQDMVYADFDLAFQNGKQAIKFSDENTKVGLLVENCGKLLGLEEEHKEMGTLENNASYLKYQNYYNSIADGAKRFDANAVKNFLKSTLVDSKSYSEAFATYRSKFAAATEYDPVAFNTKAIKNSEVTEKNRYEYGLGTTVRLIGEDEDDGIDGWSDKNAKEGLKNSESLYRAYSYMITRDGDVVISDPVYFTLYNTAILKGGN